MKTNGVYTPIFADVPHEDEEYASIQMRLDLYEDLIVATRYKAALPDATFVVDPMDLASALGNLQVGTGLLPKGCVFWSKRGRKERLAIYIEPRVWPVSVSREKRTWHVPLPGLIFLGHGREYQIYAVKEAPADDVRLALYTAPVPNMQTSGGRAICQGTAPFPVASSKTIWQAATVFFESGFNADLGQNKSRKYDKNILRMWRVLNRARATEYPLDDLVRSGLTLNHLLEEG